MPEPTEKALHEFSPSRLAVANKCGQAFNFQYVLKLPAPYDSGAMMFGNAIHDGVADWYGPDENPADHTARPLRDLVAARWPLLLPPPIWDRVSRMIGLQVECDAVEQFVLFKRPSLRSPKTTVEYLNSKPAREFNAAHTQLLRACAAREDIKWPADEDPFRAYNKSLFIADRMEARWKSLPRPLIVERPFSFEFEGLTLHGRIDQLRLDPNRETGETHPGVTDMKTGRQPMTQMEAFMQAFIYAEGVRQATDLPDVNLVNFYLARFDQYQVGTIDFARHTQLASRILRQRAHSVVTGDFTPHYGHWCKQCDFADVCSKEIGLWQDQGLSAVHDEAGLTT